MRLGAPVALHQALRRVRAAVHCVGVRVVELPQLERVDPELRGELVEHALERPRSLDEARRAEGGHRGQVQLRAVLDRADVLAGVEQLRRAGGRRQPAVPAERARVLAAEDGQRAVGTGAGRHPLDRRVAVARDHVLGAPRQGAVHGPSGAAGELGGQQQVAVDSGLRAEAPAHELADHPHLVLGQRQRLRELVADHPDGLRREVDVDPVAAPLADALMGLHRVVVERLRRVVGLDDRVGLGEPALVVAALVVARLGDERPAFDGHLRVQQRLELLPVDLDQSDGRLGLLERLRGDGGDRVALEVGLLADAVDLSRADRGQDTRQPLRRRRGRSGAPASARAGCGAAPCGASPAAGRPRCSAPRRGPSRSRRGAARPGRRRRRARPATGRARPRRRASRPPRSGPRPPSRT